MTTWILRSAVVAATLVGAASASAQTVASATPRRFPGLIRPSMVDTSDISWLSVTIPKGSVQEVASRQEWWVAEGRACDGCPWRRPGHAFVQTTAINVLYGLANLGRGQVTARVTPVTWWANMKHGWVWDLDDFGVNQIGHPYQGNNYFTSGRANGLSYWESAGVAAFGSATWEYFGETNKASVNDFINTTLGGMALGEMFHRAAWLVRDTSATGRARLWREIGATAIDPLTGINRFLSGDVSRQTGTPPELVPSSLGSLFSLGVLWQGSDNRAVRSTGTAFADVRLLYGDLAGGRSRTPYDAFFVNMRLGGGSGISRAVVRGRIVGQPLASDRAQLTVTQNYDFDKNTVYQFGAQSFEVKIGAEPRLSSRMSVWLQGGGGLTALAAVDSQPLVERDVPLPTEEESGQGVSEGPRAFDYGPGTTMSGSAVFRYDGREFAVVYYQANHVYVVDGVRANHFLQRAGLDLLLPLRGPVGLGVSGEYFHRQTFFKDVDDTRKTLRAPQLRVFLTWRQQ